MQRCKCGFHTLTVWRHFGLTDHGKLWSAKETRNDRCALGEILFCFFRFHFFRLCFLFFGVFTVDFFLSVSRKLCMYVIGDLRVFVSSCTRASVFNDQCHSTSSDRVSDPFSHRCLAFHQRCAGHSAPFISRGARHVWKIIILKK